jgi:hypothetical protein
MPRPNHAPIQTCRMVLWEPMVEVIKPLPGGLYLARQHNACPFQELYTYVVGSFAQVIYGAGVVLSRSSAAQIIAR